MPLSEGATRARHARRLLQRVLDFAPEGTTIHPIVRIGRHAAEGIVEASAEQEADLIIFGWGGKSPGRPRRRGSGGLLADDRRGRPRVAGRHRRRQAARLEGDPAGHRPGPRRAPRRARGPLRRRDRPTPRRRRSRVLHLVPPGHHPRRPRPGGARARPVRPPARQGQGRRASSARRRTSATRSCARPSGPTSSSWAPRPSRPAPTATRYLFGALPEAIAARAKPTVVVVKTRETIGRQTFEQLASRAETLAAADRAAEEARAVPARVERWFGESNFHHAEFADLRRLVQLKEKQGLTVILVLPTLNEEETIGPIVRRAMREMVGPRAAPRRDPRDRLRSRPTGPARSPRRRAPASSSTRTCWPATASFRGKGEALWKSVYETSGDIIVWADTDVRNWHPRMVYGTLGPLLARAAPAVRQGLLPAPDRPGRRPARRAAAAGSRSSSRGR